MNLDLSTSSRIRLRSRFGIAALLLASCLVAAGCDQTPSNATVKANSAPQQELTAPEVLQRMIAAYQQTEHYADEGVLNITTVENGEETLFPFPFSVEFSRPGKIQIHAYQLRMASDGEKLQCRIVDDDVNDFDGQSLQQDVTDKLTLADLYQNETARRYLQGGFGPPLALEFLLLDEPLKEMLQDEKNIELLARETIGDGDCYRVKYTDARGDMVFWIDANEFVLRRFEFPTNDYLAQYPVDQRPEKFTVVAELVNARFAEELADERFAYEPPKDAVTVSQFVLPLLAERTAMIGEAVSGLSFTDAEGKTITSQTLSGKVAVLDFWFTTCPPCRQSMPHLQKVYEQFKHNDKVVFFAVNTDEATITDDDLKKTFAEWGAAVPIGRDLQYASAQALQIDSYPTLVMIAADGTVQSYERGFDPRLVESLAAKNAAKIKVLLAGGNLAEQEIRRIKEEYERELAAAHPDARVEQAEQAKAAPAGETEKLALEKLWTCTTLTLPQNILVVPAGGDGDDTVYVIEEYRRAVTLDALGNPRATHPLDIAESDFVTYLRTAVGGNGKRYYVAGGAGQGRFHLFDEQWKKQFSRPEVDGASPMISDLVLADLDSDDQLEIYVSYYNDVAMHRFSLEGKRTAWQGGSVRDVASLALSPVDTDGKQILLALAYPGKIHRVTPDGKIDEETSVPDPAVQKLVVAKGNIDRQVFWCGLAMAPNSGAVVAMQGDGQLAWRFDVPGGFPQTTIEPLIWGQVLQGTKGHWVVAGADGGIYVLAADGTLVDRFHHGETPTGIALARLGGKPTLLVSSDRGVTAYRLSEK